MTSCGFYSVICDIKSKTIAQERLHSGACVAKGNYLTGYCVCVIIRLFFPICCFKYRGSAGE